MTEPFHPPVASALPHSTESERAVLAAVLLSPVVLSTVAGRLGVDDFYIERHRLVYQGMLELAEGDGEIDLRTLQGRLEQVGSFERVGGLAFLAGLDLDLPDLGRVGTYVEIVKERAVRRQFIRSLGAIVSQCHDGGGVDATEALGRAEKAVLALGGEAASRPLMLLDDLLEETIVHLEERVDGSLLGVSSGFPDWDRLSEGLVPGSLVILAGRPGMGKTSLALDVARHVAIHQALPVALFSLEMSRGELTQRMLASESGLPFSAVRAGRLTEGDWASLYQTVRRCVGAPLLVDDSSSPSLIEITAKARRLKAERGLGLIIIDYLQLLTLAGAGGGPRYENRQQEVTALSRSFKVLAKDLEVPVMVLSQLSRKPEERAKNHRPVLSDLRESGAIEQDADQVCFVYRDEMYNKNDPDIHGLAELIVEKNRNGPTGTVKLVFLGELATFRSRQSEEPS